MILVVPRKPGTPVRYLWGVALILIGCLVLLPSIVMAEEPIINEGAPVVIDTPLPVKEVLYQPIEFSQTDFFLVIKQRLGLAPLENSVAVLYGDNVLAVVPSDSKFVGIQIHDVCIPYQYGTDNWYLCEVALV